MSKLISHPFVSLFTHTIMTLPTITLNEINTKVYRLIYTGYGINNVAYEIIAECDKEAIFDADEAFKNNPKINDGYYHVCLKEWQSGKIIKWYC